MSEPQQSSEPQSFNLENFLTSLSDYSDPLYQDETGKVDPRKVFFGKAMSILTTVETIPQGMIPKFADSTLAQMKKQFPDQVEDLKRFVGLSALLKPYLELLGKE